MLPHPDMMFHALAVWALLYLLVAAGLWYKSRAGRAGFIRAPSAGFRWPKMRDWPGRTRHLLSRAVEILDDIYLMEWMDRAGWAGRIAKLVAVLFITSPVWILGSLWLLLMGKFIAVVFHLSGRVFY